MNRGSRELQAVARDLRHAASPAGLRGKLRRNVAAAVEPMKKQVQRNAFNIPAHGPGHTGLRVALMRATRTETMTGARNFGVRLKVDGKRMPAGQEMLPQLMEGERRWRHRVYGTNTWVPQEAHPFVAPAVPQHLPGVSRAVDAALAKTAAELSKG